MQDGGGERKAGAEVDEVGSVRKGGDVTQGKKGALFPNGNNPDGKGRSKGPTPEFRAAMWQPGQSGNPGGRKEMSPEVKEALYAATLPAMKRLIELCASGDERVALLASQAILDRAFGKAAQAVDKTVTVTTVQQQHLSILMDLQAKRDMAMKAVEVIEATTVEKKTEEGA